MQRVTPSSASFLARPAVADRPQRPVNLAPLPPGQMPVSPRLSAPPRRRRAWPRWIGTALRAGVLTAVLGGGMGFAGWAWWSGWAGSSWAEVRGSVLGWTAEFGLRVEEVPVAGREETPIETIRAVVGVQRGMPILGVDLDELRERLEALPWVETAAIERRLPSTLAVTLTERRPMALWQHERQLQVVDFQGVVLTGDKVDRFAELPLIVGENAAKNASGLLRLLMDEPALMTRLDAAVWVGERRWDLHLDNGVVVKLPEHDLEQAVRRLAEAEAAGKLLDRDIVHIDLRLPERLVVRTGRAAAARRNAPEAKI
ncbi:MAG TPA: FtsQ-type POTRA domain-containing protein [Alphaproteobacteria bacterium]|nr:FtsQ-type POTRA domain-containing protein [Alphaproteobacteria bacterium]